MVFTSRVIRSDGINYQRRKCYNWINGETDCYNIYNLFSFLKSRKGVDVIRGGKFLQCGNFAVYCRGNAYRTGSSLSRAERDELEQMPDRLFFNETDVVTDVRSFFRHENSTCAIYISNFQHSVMLFARKVDDVFEFLCYDPSHGMPQHEMVRSFVNKLTGNRCDFMRYCQNIEHGNVTGQCSMDSFEIVTKFLLLGIDPFEEHPEWIRVIDNPKARRNLWRHPETLPDSVDDADVAANCVANGIANGWVVPEAFSQLRVFSFIFAFNRYFLTDFPVNAVFSFQYYPVFKYCFSVVFFHSNGC